MGGILGEIRDIRRTVQEIGRTAQSVARAGADITGADDTFRSQDARYRTRSYNDRYRADVAEDRYRDYRDRRDDERDEDRGRGEFASGRGGKGPDKVTGGQPRGDERDGRGRSTGDADRADDPRLGATVSTPASTTVKVGTGAATPPVRNDSAVDSLTPILAAMANGTATVNQIEKFEQASIDKLDASGSAVSEIGDMKADGRITKDEYKVYRQMAGEEIGVNLKKRQLNDIEELGEVFGRIHSNELAAQEAAAAATAPTIAVGTGEQLEPTTLNATAPGTGMPAPEAPASSFTLPAASRAAAHIYTSNRSGRRMDAVDAPKISASQVKAIQQKLDVKVDGKWGPDTQAAFAAAAVKAGVKPNAVDFTNPNDPETIIIMAHFNAGVSPAEPSAPAPEQPAPAAAAAKPEAERVTMAGGAPAARSPSELFAARGFTPEIKEAALAAVGFAGVEQDGKLSEAELAMGGKLEVAAGTVGMVDDKAALAQGQQAALAAHSLRTTLAAKAEAGEVYNSTSHEFTAAPTTPDARTQAQRDNAMAGSRA